MKRRTFMFWATVVFALVIFTGCGKKAEPVEETKSVMEQPEYTETEKEVVPEPVEEETAEVLKPVDIDDGPAIYTVQLISLPDHSRVKLQQEIMEKRGITTKIKIFEMQGTTYYRLRLIGKYTKARAELLGAEMKDMFWSITDYWIVEG